MFRLSFHLRTAPLLLALGLFTLVAATASAVEVKGKLLGGAYTPPPEPEPVRAAFHWEVENGAKPVMRDRIDLPREMAAVLLGDSEGEKKDSVEVIFSGGSLLPSTIVVRQGTTLRIRNQDEIAHEVYAKGLKVFSPEAISPKAIRSIHLPEAGNWPLRDRLLTHVRGHLHVLPNLVAAAKIRPNGEFTLEGIEPGKYTLKVFHGPLELVSKSIEVADKKGEFTLGPITLTTPAKKK